MLLATRFLCKPVMASPLNSATVKSSGKPRLRGVVFDMDGTLTVPVIDFALMKRKVLGDDHHYFKSGSTSRIDILHEIEQWSPERQEKAYSVITDIERQAHERLQIMPGALELCEMLDSRQMRRGLITRNIKASVDLFHSLFGMKEFSPALSREFRPFKPNPAPLLHICKTWAVSPSEVMMVGDSINDDIPCGKDAGAITCLLDESGKFTSTDASTNVQPDLKEETEGGETLLNEIIERGWSFGSVIRIGRKRLKRGEALVNEIIKMGWSFGSLEDQQV